MVDLETVMLPIASIKQRLPQLTKLVNSPGPHNIPPITCMLDAVMIAVMTVSQYPQLLLPRDKTSQKQLLMITPTGEHKLNVLIQPMLMINANGLVRAVSSRLNVKEPMLLDTYTVK